MKLPKSLMSSLNNIDSIDLYCNHPWSSLSSRRPWHLVFVSPDRQDRCTLRMQGQTVQPVSNHLHSPLRILHHVGHLKDHQVHRVAGQEQMMQVVEHRLTTKIPGGKCDPADLGGLGEPWKKHKKTSHPRDSHRFPMSCCGLTKWKIQEIIVKPQIQAFKPNKTYYPNNILICNDMHNYAYIYIQLTCLSYLHPNHQPNFPKIPQLICHGKFPRFFPFPPRVGSPWIHQKQVFQVCQVSNARCSETSSAVPIWWPPPRWGVDPPGPQRMRFVFVASGTTWLFWWKFLL